MPDVQKTGEIKAKQSWNPWKMFDVSPEELEVIKKRKQLAAVKKAEFRLLKNNPETLVNGGTGGHIVDPQIQRWEAARATYGDHFKINRKNTAILFGVYILPIIGMYLISTTRMKAYDDKARRGEIPTRIRAAKAFLHMG